MSRRSSNRRPPARRPRTALTARRQELVTKRRGELCELVFALKATKLGFAVSKPYGDSERYDFIVDARNATDACHPEEGVFCPDEGLGHAGRRRAQSRIPNSQTTCHSERSEEPAVKPCHSERSEESAFRGSTLHRIQVKCSTQLINGLYRANAHRRIYGRAVPYLPHEIDFFAVYIVPEDTWYIIPIAAVAGRTSLLFRPRDDKKPGRYDLYREAWHLLRPNQTM